MVRDSIRYFLLRRPSVPSFHTTNTDGNTLTSPFVSVLEGNPAILIHQEDTIQHAEPRSDAALINVIRLRPHQPPNLLLPNLPPIPKQSPPKHPKLAHRPRTHPPRPRPNKIRADAARRTYELHRDPRHALVARQPRDERRDAPAVDVIPAALALRLEHELVRAAHGLVRAPTVVRVERPHAHPAVAHGGGALRGREEALEHAWARERLLHLFGAGELEGEAGALDGARAF